VERLCGRLHGVLEKLLKGTGVEPGDVVGLDVDPYGPRVVVAAEPGWARRVVLDMSPDGVEAALLLEAPQGLPGGDAEEAILEAVESLPGIGVLDEYEAAYDPEAGEAVVELHARRLTHLPSLREVAERARRALRGLAGGGEA